MTTKWKFEAARRERLAVLKAYREAQGCKDCGTRDRLLHLDHRDGTVKLFNPADVSNRAWTALWAEWAKCDVRCNSCHAHRHARQRALKNRLCSVCPRSHHARGYCRIHYGRLWTFGERQKIAS